MRITLGPSVVRGNIDESITGLWSFANVLGLLTDDIGERTAAAGVTVDGLLIKDAGIPEAAVTAHEAALAILESQITPGALLARLADAEVVAGAWRFSSAMIMNALLTFNDFASEGNTMITSDVVGDIEDRFRLHIGGIMQWGDGALARDTNLFRAAADELKTDDAFTVGGILKGLGMFVVSTKSTALVAESNNFDTGSEVFQRVTSDTTRSITGFAGGVSGRVIVFINVNVADNITLVHESASSSAANRISMPGSVSRGFDDASGTILVYDATSSRWRAVFDI